MFLRLAIIGAGQIGSRHLQALARINTPAIVQLVDPSDEALKVAVSRFNDVAKNNSKIELQCCHSIEELNLELDFVIVATTSVIRKKIIDELLKHAKVKYLLLEKVLFTKINDYYEVFSLLSLHGVTAWVNCPCRIYPAYQALKQRISSDTPVDIKISGSRWGLCCNLIHYVDLFAYLIDSYEFSWSLDGLKTELSQSARNGFIELFGSISITNPRGNLSLRCFEKGQVPSSVSILTEQFSCVISEVDNLMWIADHESQWKYQEAKFGIPFQSELTSEIVVKALSTGKVPLSSYAQSMQLHLQFLTVLKTFLQSRQLIDIETEEVRIT